MWGESLVGKRRYREQIDKLSFTQVRPLALSRPPEQRFAPICRERDEATQAPTRASAPSISRSSCDRPVPMSATVSLGERGFPADGSVATSFPVRPSPLSEGTPTTRGQSCGTIVIPAYNEAAVLARTLHSLAALSETTGIDVIVVCNGCTDNTAAVARSFRGVTVIDLPQASKTAALNVGDEHASSWPRLYLDADIEVTPGAVVALFDELSKPGVAAARPRFVYDSRDATRPVQAYYRARSRIPAAPSRLWGAGGYAVSEAGHRRFSSFPAVTADDSWIDAQFGDHEKRIVNTTPMRVRTPLDTRGLLAVLTRQRRGQVELGVPSTTTSRGRSLLASVRGPRSAADMFWYVVLTAVARRRSRAALRTQAPVWERDLSSRPASETQS